MNFKLIGIIGVCYSAIEIIYRVFTDISSISLVQTISMGILGGILGYIIGLFNEKTDWSVRVQTFAGTFLILMLEYLAGVILNISMGLSIWDYSDRFMNLHGQICLMFAVIWFFFVPFVIWLDDHLRHNVFGEEANPRMIDYYKKLVLGDY